MALAVLLGLLALPLGPAPHAGPLQPRWDLRYCDEGDREGPVAAIEIQAAIQPDACPAGRPAPGMRPVDRAGSNWAGSGAPLATRDRSPPLR